MFSNATLTSSEYTNPIIDSNIPDPGILALPDGSGYVLVSTSNYAESGNGIFFIYASIIRNLFFFAKKIE